MSMEPGLDLHGWQTEREALQPELEDAPEQALPELADLVRRMLDARGYDLESEPTEAGDEPEVLDRYRAARDTADLAERGDADPGDVADAINALSELYDELVVERGAP